MLQTAGLGLTAALAGGLLGQAAGRLPNAAPESSIVPSNGAWRPVLPVAALPAGSAMAYSTRAMDALIVNDRGTIRALSAACTHLGCRLAADPSAARIDCPCHKTAFANDGTVMTHELPATPPRLPSVLSRVRSGTIELFLV